MIVLLTVVASFLSIIEVLGFLDLNEESLNKIIQSTGLKLLELEITEDVKGRNNTRWLNVILGK